MKICIVGGGSTYTPELIEGLIQISDQVPFDEIYMLDIPENKEKFDIVSAFAQRMLKKSGISSQLHTTMDSEKAIKGADFVLFQFRAGLLQGRINDELVPLEFGLIGQETTGMGGMACALRAFPIVENYVQQIKTLAPNAWIINFSNPSGMLSEFMINYLQYEKTIGLCNVPIEFVLEAAKAFETTRDHIFLKYYGLNHLSWVEQVMVDNVDRTNEMWDRFRLNMKNIPATDYEPDFLHKLRLLPNPYLRYFYMTDKMLQSEFEDRESKGTRGQVIQGIEKELLELYKKQELNEKPSQLEQRGGFMYSTVATELIRDIVTDAGHIHIVNKPNNQTVSDLDDDYVLEIPARLTASGPESVSIGNANKATTGLIHTIKNFERLTIEGYLNKDESLIKQAMLIHPLGPKESQLEPLWSRLQEVNKDYWKLN